MEEINVHTEYPENYKILNSRSGGFDQTKTEPTLLIKEILKIIETHRGQKISINEIPLSDPETFALFKKREVEGISWLEYNCRKVEMYYFSIDCLEDLTKYLGSLIIQWHPENNSVPGIFENIWEFIYVRDNPNAVEYFHPVQGEILKENSGYILFREDLAEIATRTAGLTMEEAFNLIKEITSGDLDKYIKERERFIAGAISNSYTQKEADEIFNTITKAAPIVTDKASAEKDALLIYRLLYLKTHYPLEFNTALITDTKGPAINSDPDE